MAWSAAARSAALAARRRFHARFDTKRVVGPLMPKQAKALTKRRKEAAIALRKSKAKGGLWPEIYRGAKR